MPIQLGKGYVRDIEVYPHLLLSICDFEYHDDVKRSLISRAIDAGITTAEIINVTPNTFSVATNKVASIKANKLWATLATPTHSRSS